VAPVVFHVGTRLPGLVARHQTATRGTPCHIRRPRPSADPRGPLPVGPLAPPIGRIRLEAVGTEPEPEAGSDVEPDAEPGRHSPATSANVGLGNTGLRPAGPPSRCAMALLERPLPVRIAPHPAERCRLRRCRRPTRRPRRHRPGPAAVRPAAAPPSPPAPAPTAPPHLRPRPTPSPPSAGSRPRPRPSCRAWPAAVRGSRVIAAWPRSPARRRCATAPASTAGIMRRMAKGTKVAMRRSAPPAGPRRTPTRGPRSRPCPRTPHRQPGSAWPRSRIWRGIRAASVSTGAGTSARPRATPAWPGPMGGRAPPRRRRRPGSAASSQSTKAATAISNEISNNTKAGDRSGRPPTPPVRGHPRQEGGHVRAGAAGHGVAHWRSWRTGSGITIWIATTGQQQRQGQLEQERCG